MKRRAFFALFGAAASTSCAREKESALPVCTEGCDDSPSSPPYASQRRLMWLRDVSGKTLLNADGLYSANMQTPLVTLTTERDEVGRAFLGKKGAPLNGQCPVCGDTESNVWFQQYPDVPAIARCSRCHCAYWMIRKSK